MLKHDAFFFVWILVFIFIVWVAVGGPSRPISWAGPLINAPSIFGSGRAYFLPSAGFKIGTTNSTISGATNSTGTSSANNSPYKNLVMFTDGGAAAKQTLASVEYLSIRVSGKVDAGITISGWRLLSLTTGNSVVIGTGTVLPIPGGINPQSPIVLHTGDTVYFSTGSSPVGTSFRENMCTGYFDQYRQLKPSLSHICPTATSEYKSFYSDTPLNTDQCWIFVRSIGQCQLVTNFPFDKNGSPISQTCQNFVRQHLTYTSCVAENSSSKNFAGKIWHVYFGRTIQLWNQPHDTIELIDANGKVVDTLTY